YDLIFWESDQTFEGDFAVPNIGTEVNLEFQPKATIVKDLRADDLLSSVPSSNARRNIKRGLKRLEENNLEFSFSFKLSEEELLQVYELFKLVGENKDFRIRSFE